MSQGLADSYKTLAGPSESLYKVKGSKHFGYAFPVMDESAIKEHLDQLRKEHHQARHHCYAWALGAERTHYRANDDGEPSGTAGKPIFGQIQSFDLSNVLIVVVRYFGGVKLGAGGLIDAYRTAARMAIESGVIVEKTVEDHLQVRFPYEAMSKVMKVMKELGFPQSHQEFDLNCSLRTSCRLSLTAGLLHALEVEDVSGKPNEEGVAVELLYSR